VGAPKAIRVFLSEGWREVSPTERWWELTLTSAVEQTRKTNLELLGGLCRSVKNAKILYYTTLGRFISSG